MPRCCHSSGLRCLYGPIVHIRRLHVEQVADANSAGAACELACDRRLRHAGACRHEGAAPAEPVEVDGEVLGGNALKRAMNVSRSEWTVLMRLIAPADRLLAL